MRSSSSRMASRATSSLSRRLSIVDALWKPNLVAKKIGLGWERKGGDKKDKEGVR